MARFVDLDEEEDAGAGLAGGPRAGGARAHHEAAAPPPLPMPVPMPGQLQLQHDANPQLQQLSQKEQHLLLLKKLHLLSANGRNGPWSHSLYNPEPIGTMDSSTFRAPVTDAMQIYP